MKGLSPAEHSILATLLGVSPRVTSEPVEMAAVEDLRVRGALYLVPLDGTGGHTALATDVGRLLFECDRLARARAQS